MKLVYIIGIPGTGKSTLMKALMKRIGKNWSQERVTDLLDTHVHCKYEDEEDGDAAIVHHIRGTYRVLGKYEEGETFSGTDRLSMAVAPKAIEWVKTKPNEVIFGEGDRLNSKTFFEAVGEDLTIIHLKVSDSTREKRYEERGSNQSDKFIQTTKTKCQNVLEAFGDRSTLFGEEKGCVVEFPHETPEDTDKIVRFLLSI